MIHVYTDGACKGNPGVGGWGVLWIENDRETEFYGKEQHTTNNRMELTAVIKAMEMMHLDEQYMIYTDSQYLYKGVTSWLKTWKKKGFRTSKNTHVLNKELWMQIDNMNGDNISFCWVKAHNGNKGNEKADKLANKAISS